MASKLPLLLLSLLSVLKVSEAAEAPCICSASSCSCSYRSLTSVPQDLPTTITDLYLEGLGKLEYFWLNNNVINDIQAGTFSPTQQLRSLRLDGNKLRKLRPNMFTGLRNLQQLRLDNNEINGIQGGTFNPTSNLRNLYLYHNYLATLRSEMFEGMGNLQILWLNSNEINDIQAGTFTPTQQLVTLRLDRNKLTKLISNMFTGLGNLQNLWLNSSDINDIEAGTFSPTPQLTTLYLHRNRLKLIKADIFSNLLHLKTFHVSYNNIETFPTEVLWTIPPLTSLELQNNRMMTLPRAAYDKLSSISDVNIDNNPWRCDCEIVPFRLKMNGSNSFENQITCSHPHNLNGQRLKDISPEEMTSDCEEPTILRFERDGNKTLVHGDTFYLVCEASGVPAPDITVILISGVHATVESGGRVTMQINGTVSMANVTAEAGTGLHVCIAASFVGSTSTTLSEDVPLKEPMAVTMAPVTAPPHIVRFEVNEAITILVHWETLQLVCEASGIPTPDVTFILPSGRNATVTSDGRVTVDVNGTMVVRDVTAEDAGLYVCIAASPVGATFATLFVDVQQKESTTVTLAPVTSNLTMTGTSSKPESISYHKSRSAPTTSRPILSESLRPKPPKSGAILSLPVFIGYVCGSIVTLLIATIILTIWYKKKTQNAPSDPNPQVVYSNTTASVTISGQDQTRYTQTQSGSLKGDNTHVSGSNTYEDIDSSTEKM
uniref:Ig-like domain-containing protein n=1 Tax=Branchiostoma floridae TaxID=7739 RepID=C3XRK0_BRAFL|eukprot:XP_002613309.1 hypothetical protein BRAFLDRAFT_68275 [Branchiostoma floridae]